MGEGFEQKGVGFEKKGKESKKTIQGQLEQEQKNSNKRRRIRTKGEGFEQMGNDVPFHVHHEGDKF